MYVVMHNLYGLDGNAYYKKNGDCFDFSIDKSFASNLTQQECETILKNQDWYCHQYRASHMTVES